MFDPRWDNDPRERDDQSRDLSRGSRGGSDPRERERTDPRDVFMDHVSLPRGLEREHVHYHGHDYTLRGSETRTLTTVGTFRVARADDLRDTFDRSLDPRHGEPRRLVANDSAGAWAPPDRLLFVRQGALVAVPLDAEKGETTGEPITVADPVSVDAQFRFGGFSVSAAGRVAYRAGGSEDAGSSRGTSGTESLWAGPVSQMTPTPSIPNCRRTAGGLRSHARCWAISMSG